MQANQDYLTNKVTSENISTFVCRISSLTLSLRSSRKPYVNQSYSTLVWSEKNQANTLA